ncbi:hypothetical protein AGMMS50218_04310 [Actinomycetota bacterium]|nr:hypothetical protein AGMMS50218_04310 [Actinomycetota bacterium]
MGALTTTTGQPWSGRLASGPAALTVVLRWVQCMALFAIVGILLAGEALGVWGSRHGVLAWGALTAWEALAAAVAALMVLYIVQDTRETRRGYTTTYNRMQSLAQLDPRTHQIVRAPGAPYVTRRRGRLAP